MFREKQTKIYFVLWRVDETNGWLKFLVLPLLLPFCKYDLKLLGITRARQVVIDLVGDVKT